MKALLFLVLLLPALLHANDLEGDIFGLDAKAGTLTLSAGTKLVNYHVRLTTEITINSIKAKFGELKEGMTAKIVSAEPSVAAKIIATGMPNLLPDSSPAMTASVKAMDELKEKLKDSKWDQKDGKTFELHADGTTRGSWHERKGFWKVVGPNLIDMHVNWGPSPPDHVTVSPDANLLHWGKQTAVRMKK